MHDFVLSTLQEIAFALVSVGVAFLIAFLKKKIGVAEMQKLAEQSALIRQIVEAGVKYAEQTFSAGEKLDKAVEWISTSLATKGIQISAEEIEGLIEATLRDIKDKFGEEWANSTSKKEETK